MFAKDLIDEDMTDGQNIAMALYAVAQAIEKLGFNGNDGKGPGAIEGHTMMLRDAIAPLIADAIQGGLERIAEAISESERREMIHPLARAGAYQMATA